MGFTIGGANPGPSSPAPLPSTQDAKPPVAPTMENVTGTPRLLMSNTPRGVPGVSSSYGMAYATEELPRGSPLTVELRIVLVCLPPTVLANSDVTLQANNHVHNVDTQATVIPRGTND